MGIDTEFFFALVAVNILGSIFCCCINAKHVDMKYDDRSLNQKERKNCMRRCYIWLVMIIGTAFWVIGCVAF